MATLALILSLIGLLTSFLLFGLIPAFLGVVLSMVAMGRKPSVVANIALFTGIMGIILPVFFFLNSYGFTSPAGVLNGTAKPLEEPLFFRNPAVEEAVTGSGEGEELPPSGMTGPNPDGFNEVIDAATYENRLPDVLKQTKTAQYDDAYAHCYDYFFTNTGSENLSASFTYKALNEGGEVIATVVDTISGIPAGSQFVSEAVFNKNVGEIADVVFEAQTFPCGNTVYATNLVDVRTKKITHGERVEAVNHASEDVRVNVHVLFYNGSELVQNSWVVPSNTQKFTISPDTTGAIEAVCRAGDYTRVEVYYGALRVAD